MTSFSPFIVSPREAADLARAASARGNDNVGCFLLSVRFLPVYGAVPVPAGVYKKLPRMVNGIPLGPGRLSHIEPTDILWKYVEGCSDVHTFVSQPMTQEEAEQTRLALLSALVKHAKTVFGDVTVKASVTLSQCLAYDSDLIVNDIAEPMDKGMHFID